MSTHTGIRESSFRVVVDVPLCELEDETIDLLSLSGESEFLQECTKSVDELNP